MKDIKGPTKKLSASRTIWGIVLSIAILIISQTLALSISEIPVNFGVSGAVCNILAGFLYVIFAFTGTMLLYKKFLKMSMDEMRIPHIQLKKFGYYPQCLCQYSYCSLRCWRVVIGK